MKGSYLVIFTLVVLLTLSLSSFAAAEVPKYIMGIDGDYPPFTFIDADGTPTGFDVDSVHWIAEEMGFEVEIVPFAWDGIIPNLLAKNMDFIYSGMSITEERAQMVNFTEPYWVIDQAVAAREGEGKTLEGFLAGEYTVGTQRGCTAAMWVEDNLVQEGILPRENFMLYDNFPIAVTDLLAGRIETGIMDEPAVLMAIDGQPLEMIGTISTGEGYGIAVRKEDTELLDMLNEGLDRLKNSTYWVELREKWDM